MKRRRGMSLLEILLTTLLLGIVLSVFASLVHGYNRVMKHVSGKDRALEGLHSGLSVASAEIGSATQVLSPTGATAVGVLDFTRIDPGNTGRFPSVAPASWDPLAGAQQMRVRYYRLNTSLIREVTPSGGTPLLQPVAENVTDFRTSMPASGLIEIQATFQQEKLSKTFLVRGLRRVLQ
jgi:prepilin-type N-terminal cleavage/methylation domain-containing protein